MFCLQQITRPSQEEKSDEKNEEEKSEKSEKKEDEEKKDEEEKDEKEDSRCVVKWYFSRGQHHFTVTEFSIAAIALLYIF